MRVSKNVFADYAEKYHQQGLPIFPVGREKGKTPLVRWASISKKGVRDEALAKFIEQFPDANIGLALGVISGLTVIDDDGNRLPEDIFDIFGYTPLYVQTPSKGGHYYYAYNNEKNLRNPELNLEVKSQGTYVALPPSVSPENGRAYELKNSGLSRYFLNDLPKLDPNTVNRIMHENTLCFGTVYEGERNKALFAYLRSIAYKCDSEKELLNKALDYNEANLCPPLYKKDVKNTSKSVWRYRASGKVILPRQQYASLSIDSIKSLSSNAILLLSFLQASHKGLKSEFIICPPAMAREKLIQLSVGAIKRAVKELMCFGILIRTHEGGKGARDPHRYEFGEPDYSKLR